jgi:hypothetical protein
VNNKEKVSEGVSELFEKGSFALLEGLSSLSHGMIAKLAGWSESLWQPLGLLEIGLYHDRLPVKGSGLRLLRPGHSAGCIVKVLADESMTIGRVI